jgi:hypothetical protein
MSPSSTPAPIAALERAAVGVPIIRAGVSLFPVYLFQPLRRTLVTAQRDAIEITEAERESVPTLTVTSAIDDPFLLVEGETLSGGLQQRTLNVSVLVPPRQRLDIPVSCVESGRWRGDRTFSGSSGHVSRRVRRAKSATVYENLRHGGSKRTDQRLVWDAVGYELSRLDVASDTDNFADADRVLDAPVGSDRSQWSRLAQAVDDLAGSGPLPGQCGVVVAHGARVVAAEVFASPELLAGQWTAMTRAQMLDAPTRISGRPSASKALRFLRSLANGDGIEADGVGLGRERHVRTKRLIGQLLTWDDAIVHASAFALAA